MSNSTQHKSFDNAIEAWKIKLAFFMAIVTPTLALAGTYWKLRLEINDTNASVTEKVTQLELKQEKSFVDKESFKEMQKDIKQLTNDMTEVKTLLRKKL